MTDLCSECGRDMDVRHFCAICRHEMLCGEIAQVCDHPGCRERRLPLRYGLARDGDSLEPPRWATGVDTVGG